MLSDHESAGKRIWETCIRKLLYCCGYGLCISQGLEMTWILYLNWLSFFALSYQPTICMGVIAKHHESLLVESLLDNIDPRVRPVPVATEPVIIKLGVALRQVLELNQKKQLMKSSVWMRMYWNDSRLTWEPSKHNNTQTIFIPHTQHWKPDIVLYNNAADELKPVLQDVITVVTHTGAVTYMFPALYHTACHQNTYYFPMDQQDCHMKFGSWAFDGGMVDLRLKDDVPADASNYHLNTEWMLTKFTAERNEELYGCCPFPFYDVTFHVTLRRRWTMIFLFLMLPNLFINMMVAMQFLLPCDSGEKVTLGITIFLTMVVYLLLLNDILPTTDDIPIIIRYLATTIVSIGVSMAAEILVLMIHNNGKHDNHSQVPDWVRYIFLHGLARILGMHRYITPDTEHAVKLKTYTSDMGLEEESDEEEEEEGHKESQHAPGTEGVSLRISTVHVDSAARPTSPSIHRPHAHRDHASNSRSFRRLSVASAAMVDPKDIVLFRIMRNLEQRKEQETEENRDTELKCEWQQVAMVMDRLLFILYFFMASVLILSVYAQMPTYHDSEISPVLPHPH